MKKIELRKITRPIDPETGLEEEKPPFNEYLKYFLYILLIMVALGVTGFFLTSFINGTIL